MEGICHFASEERCGAKIMILSGRLTRRLLRKQGTEKVIFRFPFFCLSLFLSSHPYSLSGKKFERVESMKGVENKGTTIVEGTKTSSLKFQRLASLRRKKNKKKKGEKERKGRKHHVGTWNGEKKREIGNYLVQDVIFRRKLFVRPTFSTINSSTTFLQFNTLAIVIDFVITSFSSNRVNKILVLRSLIYEI